MDYERLNHYNIGRAASFKRIASAQGQKLYFHR